MTSRDAELFAAQWVLESIGFKPGMWGTPSVAIATAESAAAVISEDLGLLSNYESRLRAMLARISPSDAHDFLGHRLAFQKHLWGVHINESLRRVRAEFRIVFQGLGSASVASSFFEWVIDSPISLAPDDLEGILYGLAAIQAHPHPELVSKRYRERIHAHRGGSASLLCQLVNEGPTVPLNSRWTKRDYVLSGSIARHLAQEYGSGSHV